MDGLKILIMCSLLALPIIQLLKYWPSKFVELSDRDIDTCNECYHDCHCTCLEFGTKIPTDSEVKKCPTVTNLNRGIK